MKYEVFLQWALPGGTRELTVEVDEATAVALREKLARHLGTRNPVYLDAGGGFVVLSVERLLVGRISPVVEEEE